MTHFESKKKVVTTHRSEKDSMDAIDVPADKLWGAQTQRSPKHFRISSEKTSRELIYTLALTKRAAARVNQDLGLLTAEKVGAIAAATDKVLAGKHAQEFPLTIWQTGSGIQSNMNMNEVLANRASELLGGERGMARKIHPNDDVNKSQSSSDMFPTAMHVTTLIAMREKMIPSLQALRATLNEKAVVFRDIVKIGRTHLQDATPLTLGQEISGWVAMLDHSLKHIEASQPHLAELALGGTAVGAGPNTHPEYAVRVAAELTSFSGQPFATELNRFKALTTMDALVHAHGALKDLTASLMKIANDVRWLVSGPRCGIGEVAVPGNEPGSSIMPGKVNSTQCEVLAVVCCQVMGDDVAMNIGGASGNFEFNVYRPMVIRNFLQSVRLLANGMASSNEHRVVGIEPDHERISQLPSESLMLVTTLNTRIGYDKAVEIAKKAHHEGLTLKASALALGYLTEAEFDSRVRPEEMVDSLATRQPARGAGAG